MNRELLYWGPSMNPTLRPGDCLQIVPCGHQEIQVGDVAVFRNPRGQDHIVHRVVAIYPQGIRTQGDNCLQMDEWILQPQDIEGLVEAIRRGDNLLPVPKDNRKAIRVFQFKKNFGRLLSRLLHPVYYRLANSRLFHGLVFAWMTPQLLCFPRSEGPEWQLWLGKLLVGRKLPHQPGWYIRRPFRLFVDEACLPGHPPEVPESHHTEP